MKVTACELPGLLLLEPRVFSDPRGFFMESWNRRSYAEHGLEADFVADDVLGAAEWIAAQERDPLAHEFRRTCS